jgi:hypothetical protein
MSLSITYSLVGPGWARCVVESEKSKCELGASYLSDALGNLVLSAIASVSGFRSSTFGFDEEPGEYRWVIESTDVNTISVEVLEFQELWGTKPNTEGKSLFRTVCAPITYARAVAMAANSVLEEHGLDGYLGKWMEHAFPERQLQLLEERIASVQNDG